LKNQSARPNDRNHSVGRAKLWSSLFANKQLNANFLSENLPNDFNILNCHFTRLPSPNAQSYGYINNIDNMPHCPDYNHCRSGIGGQAFFRPRRISLGLRDLHFTFL